MWKPTGRHFTLYDSYPLTRILEPTVEPIELSPSVSSSTKIPMLSKFVVVTLGMETRRAADYYRNLYVDISQFVDRSTNSMHTKPHQAKRVVNTSTNAWNATKNTVARTVPIWKPTGRRFNLHDIFGSRTSTKSIVKPIELSLSVSSSSKIPMLSKFVPVTLGMKSWFKGIPAMFE
nr:hypothetical protein [Tanacetum cinerariifolium]